MTDEKSQENREKMSKLKQAIGAGLVYLGLFAGYVIANERISIFNENLRRQELIGTWIDPKGALDKTREQMPLSEEYGSYVAPFMVAGGYVLMRGKKEERR